MRKLKHYPNVWQASPFSMEMFAHFEKDARLAGQEVKTEIKKTRKSKLKLALGW